MIIDIHCHIGTGDRLEDTYQMDCRVEDVLAAMDEADVDKTCIMPVGFMDYERGIQEVREAAAAQPDRLIGFARVRLAEERALSQVRRCFEQYGFRGLKIHAGMGDGFPTRALMELLSEYGRPLLMHAPAEVQTADAITNLARAFPKVPVICGHMGGLGGYFPVFVKYYAVEAQRLPNLYLDTALVLLHQWIRIAVEICGPEKVLFASDGPFGSPGVARRHVELCHFSQAEEAMILGGNAQRLLRA